MSACMALLDDYDSLEPRRLAKVVRDPRQVRRLLALATAYDIMSRAAAKGIFSPRVLPRPLSLCRRCVAPLSV